MWYVMLWHVITDIVLSTDIGNTPLHIAVMLGHKGNVDV